MLIILKLNVNVMMVIMVQWCENDLCLKLNCQNNSTCQRLSNGQAKCLCNEQWYGNECQYDVNECIINKTNIMFK